MGEGEQGISHFPTAQRLRRWLTRPRNAAILVAALVALWLLVPWGIGIFAIQRRQSAARPIFWTNVIGHCARISPLMGWHLRQHPIDHPEENRVAMLFYMAYHFDPERQDALLTELRETILDRFSNENDNAWRKAMAGEVTHWASLLQQIDPGVASDIAEAAGAHLPLSAMQASSLRVYVLPAVPRFRAAAQLTLGIAENVEERMWARPQAIGFHPGGNSLAVANHEGVHVFGVESLQRERLISVVGATELAFNTSGSTLAAIANGHDIHLIDWETGEPTATWSVAGARAETMHFIDERRLLAHWSYGNPAVQIWDHTAQAVVGGFSLPGRPGERFRWAFWGDRMCLSPDQNAFLSLRSAVTGDVIASPSPLALPATFTFLGSEDQILIAEYAGGGAIRLTEWKPETNTTTALTTVVGVLSPALLEVPGTESLAMLDGGTGAILLDVSDWSPEAALILVHANENCAAASPDGSLLAIGSTMTNEVAIFDLTELETEDPTP